MKIDNLLQQAFHELTRRDINHGWLLQHHYKLLIPLETLANVYIILKGMQGEDPRMSGLCTYFEFDVRKVKILPGHDTFARMLERNSDWIQGID